jgi:hypothetical protein
MEKLKIEKSNVQPRYITENEMIMMHQRDIADLRLMYRAIIAKQDEKIKELSERNSFLESK